ncbi:MAG: ABC transporter substrate-binding protein [Deltaproteobacteria bacterium]|nr:ABC transporter substrate-binding protein [Deltaproteobacteria bacterium]
MKKPARYLFLAIAVVCLSITSAGADDVIKIGAIFSATGPASPLGEAEKNTALLLQEQINAKGGVMGKKLEIIIYDDESSVDKAVSAADKLLKKDNVVAVVGPSTTPNTLAIEAKFEAAAVPLVSCAAGEKIVVPVKKWVFKTPQSDRLAVARILSHLKSRKISKIAIITVSDAYGQGGREMLKALAPKAGIELTADEVYSPKDTDMTVQLTKIKSTNAKAIVSWGTPQTGSAIVAKNRAQLGMSVPLYLSHGVAARKFIELAGSAGEGILLPAGRLIVADEVPAKNPQKALLTKYVKDYETKFKSPVSTFGGHAWDAVMLVVKAIELGKSDKPADIRANLEKIKGFVGTAGVFNFSPEEHNGLNESAFEMVTIQKGDWKIVK